MDQSESARMRHLLQVSINLRDRMSEVRELRSILRRAEWKRHCSKSTDADGAEDKVLRPSA